MNALAMRRLRVSVLLSIVSAFSFGVYAAEKKPTLADIEDKQDLSYLETIPPASERGNAIFEYRKFLQVSRKGTEQRRQVLVRLAELELELSEKLLVEETPNEQGEQLDMNKTIASSIYLFETAVKEFPKYSDNDRVLYQLARAYDIAAKPQELSETLERLVTGYPQSGFYTESQFRLAESYFINRRYEQARQAYTAVLSKPSEFYDNALYKRGWSYFKLNQYQPALDDFVAVLDKHQFSSEKQLTRIEKELYDDTLRVISLSFAYLKGVKTLNRYFADKKDRPYIRDIYYSLGQHYLDKKRYADTADVYSAFVKRYKHSKYAPDMSLQTIVVWQKSQIPGNVLTAREAFARDFSLSSTFWTVHKIDDFPKVKAALKKNIRLLAEYHHSLGQKKKSLVDKRKATNWYAEYIRSFPADPETPHLHFLYAELLSELKQPDKAFHAYEAVAYQYAKNKHSAEAAYAAVLTATSIAKSAPDKSKQKTQWQLAVVRTTLKFAEAYPKDRRVKNTLLHVAEIQYEQGKMLEAIEMAEKVLPNSTADQQKKALLILAHGQFELEFYSEAEKNYRKLIKLIDKKHKEYGKIRERIAISIYKEGELALKSGKTEAGIAALLRIKQVVPGSPIIANAEFDAANELMKTKQWKQAIPVLTRFRKAYPGHKLNNDVTTKLAVAYTETGQFDKAAVEYAYMLKFIKDKDKRRLAYYQVAEFYEKAKNYNKAIGAYQDYLKRYPQPFDIAMETRQKMVELYVTTKNPEKQREWQRLIIVADSKAGKARNDRSKYLAATASIALADRVYQKYTWVKLKAPFKKNLKIKKQRMKETVTAYANVAKYQIAETTTQATFKIGEVYNNFSKSLMKSERPKNLNAEELEQYNILLEEQAFPFEEKAIEFYKTNLDRTRDDVYDEWVQRSVQRLGELFPGRYLRRERLEVIINAL